GGDVNENNKNGDDDGDVLREVFLDEFSHEVQSQDSLDETDVEAMEEKLRRMKLEKKKLEKKEKVRRLSREAEEVEQSIKKMKSKKDHRAPIDAAALRGMDDIARKVDRVMDRKLKQNLSSSSSSSSSESESSSEESSESDSSKRSSKNKKKQSKRREKKSKAGKHRSGKSKKLTSYVKYPQKWPHSHLSLHFVNKDKKYEDLSISEFCAGFSAILEVSSEQQKVARISHLKELMYLSTTHHWKNVLSYHAACLLEIERGHLRWGDSFQMLQSTTLAGGFLRNPSSSRGGFQSQSNQNRDRASSSDEGRIIFCRNFQRGNCHQSRDHYGQYNGANQLLKHICATCWLTNRQVSPHSENSETCPLRGDVNAGLRS
ncbi:MAG: hypothetical protein MK195_09080, partial [Acidimicrobiales bacterium]|nr:hypothetical protein [Acidimicrobiales bacterium]